MAVAFVQKLVEIAQNEFDQFHETNETEEPLRSRIDTYCDDIGVPRPSDISDFAWSATFISWCEKTAGATAQEFKFSIRHSEFVNAAIRNADRGTGAFRARRIDAYAPKIGDLIQSNREGGQVDYDEARERTRYPSHSAIVVELVTIGGTRFAITIGGNESDSVRRTRVPLTAAGLVKQRSTNPYICVVETLKTDAPIQVARPLMRAAERAAAGQQMLLRLSNSGNARAKGPIVEILQRALGNTGFPVSAVDGEFGPDTHRAFNAWQRATGRAESVGISSPEWTALTGRPEPSVFDLALQFTASFEGTGFTGAVGNFDGAGITFGIIGFTARHGELRRLVDNAKARDASILQRSFGPLAQELIDGLSGSPAELIDFANSISLPPRKYKLQPEWRAAFAKFGAEPIVRQLQLEAAEQRYWTIAKKFFRHYHLGDARDAALLYDCAVQNGGVKDVADAAIRSRLSGGESAEERRLVIAEEVRDASNPRWHEDVFSRKSCIATGEGRVHGARFDLLDWGLGTQAISDADLDAPSQLAASAGPPVAAPLAARMGIPIAAAAPIAAAPGLRSYYPHWVWRKGQLNADILGRLPAGAIIGVHHVWDLEDIRPILDFPAKDFQISWYTESNTQETDGEEPDVVGKPVKSRIAEAQRKQTELAARYGDHRFAGLIELDAARDKAEGDLEGAGNQVGRLPQGCQGRQGCRVPLSR